MLCGTVCLSHSPLMHHNRAPADVEARWNEAITNARTFIEQQNIEQCLIFFPDHVNGFLYDLMPPFCIGAAGESLGDFGTAPGAVDISEELAADCHAFCLAQGIDLAISYNMTIDHGATQPFEALARPGGFTGFIPVFINCVAPPFPTFERVRALGRAVGNWAQRRPERFLIVGSGGLSHNPPLPSLTLADGAVATRLRKGGRLPYHDRFARQQRVLSEGKIFRSGSSSLKPLNPDWDHATLASLALGKLDVLDGFSDAAISEIAGNGAHEMRTWIASLAALDLFGGFDTQSTFYAAIDEWITGMGALVARPPHQHRQGPEKVIPPSANAASPRRAEHD